MTISSSCNAGKLLLKTYKKKRLNVFGFTGKVKQQKMD